jgi:hypothetical protein
MRAIGKLTALTVERAKKRGMHGDGLGLYLQVAEGGSRSWVLRYKRDGRSHYFGLGALHTVSLAKARERAAEARLQLLENKDPIEAARASRAARSNAMTFDACAAAYVAAHRPGWRSAVHAAQWEQTIAMFASPIIGAMDVRAIGVEHVMRVLGDLWKEKPETASRLRGRIESILGWAKVRGYRSGENPATWKGNLQSLLPASRKVKKAVNHPALSYVEIGGFMTELRKQEGVGARALEFLILTATRTGETRHSAWNEIDLGQKLWAIPPSRTKTGR